MTESTRLAGTTRRRLLAVSLVAVALLGGAPGRAEEARRQKPKPAVSAVDVAQRIHRLINEVRRKHNLPALAWDGPLARIAARHSRDMGRRNYFDHDSPEGRGFAHRYRQDGYRCEIRTGNIIHGGAENIALGRLYNSVTRINGVAYHDWNSPETIARQTVDGWMNSTGHRRNILTPHWRRQGVGIDIRPDNRVLITQNFC
jgi:uncharacterized protein YkwD